MANTKKTIRYTEPANYFPEEIRKEFKLGEYADKPAKSAKAAHKASKPAKTVKRGK